MKKKVFVVAIIVSVFCLSLFVMYAASFNTQKKYNQGTEIIYCTISNYLQKEMVYIDEFSLEFYGNKGWEKVKENGDVIFDFVLHSLKPQEKKVLGYPVSMFSKLQTTGIYRIAQRVYIDGREVVLYAYFRIE